jgi:DSF synthase
MTTSTLGLLHEQDPSTDAFATLNTRYDPDRRILCYGLKPSPRPCFTEAMLAEIQALQRATMHWCKQAQELGQPTPVEFLVAHSETPCGSWLGGDLGLFVECLRGHDRARLAAYARLAIEVLYSNYRQLECGITTVALLRGDALGAAFESALSCDMVIAEEGAKVGFPEVLFNLFPGMGGYSFLSRRASASLAERMIGSGRLYASEEMAEYGGVDHLIGAGTGLDGVFQVIQRQSRRLGTLRGLHCMRRAAHPVTLEELNEISEHWLDTALSLGDAEVQRMDQLCRAQERRFALPQPDSLAM